MSAGVVVVLDGPTQVGRSTTLAGLQAAWPRVRSGPLLEAGLDAALAAFGPGARRWAELVLPAPAPGGDQHPRVVWGPLGRELVAGMHRAAAAWARAGLDVAMDHVLLDRTTVADLAAALDGLPVVHVALTCDPDVLEDRERSAGVWPEGMAVAQLETTRGVAERHLWLDTSEATTEELVELVLTEVERRLRG